MNSKINFARFEMSQDFIYEKTCVGNNMQSFKNKISFIVIYLTAKILLKIN